MPAGPPTELIFGEWYPALRTSSLGRGRAVKTLLLGVPLLVGRKTDGALFALRDLCPHRGIPLSAGWFDGETVQCKYHGWKFEPCSGQCTEIPSLASTDTLEPTKIYANAFPAEERDGYAWVYVPAAGSGRLRGALPAIPELPKFSARFRSAHLTADLPCNVDHGIIGLMDPAHGPFVHQSWWWRSQASIHEKTKHFEPIPQGFRMSSHAPSAPTPPPINSSASTASPSPPPSTSSSPTAASKPSAPATKWFSSLTTVTPVTPSTCRIDVVAAWNVFYNMCRFVTPIAKFFGNALRPAGSADHDRAGRRASVTAPPSCSSTTPTSPPSGISR